MFCKNPFITFQIILTMDSQTDNTHTKVKIPLPSLVEIMSAKEREKK